MNAGQLLEALALKYCRPEYILVPGVRDSAGFDAARTADAIAIGLWPSRGLEIVGFEIKTERSDWLRELKKPEKAETFAGHICDQWYIVAGERGLVVEPELPKGWGLIEPRGSGLSVKVKSALHPLKRSREALKLDRSFVASLFRRFADHTANETDRRIEKELSSADAYSRGHTDAENKLSPQIRALEGAVNACRESNKQYANIQKFVGGRQIDLDFIEEHSQTFALFLRLLEGDNGWGGNLFEKITGVGSKMESQGRGILRDARELERLFGKTEAEAPE